MRFSNDVVMFSFSGIPIVGCVATGAVIGLTQEGAEVCQLMQTQSVSEDRVSAVDVNLLEHLKAGGFFGVEKNDEKVVSAYLHVTQRCNLDCAGCYSLDEHRNVLADASLEEMQHAVRSLAEAGAIRLVISGGEPFLRNDLPDIVAYAKEQGISNVTVLSNGTRITKDALERLAPVVDCVSVSIDGSSADSPAYIRQKQRFDELVEAVKMIQAAGIPAHIIPTVHAQNVADLADYVALSKELGVTLNFSLLTCEPNDKVLGRLLPQDDELIALGQALLTLDDGKPILAMDAPVGVNLAAKINCGAGSKSLSIDADGTIYPCHMMHRKELAMGNAFTDSVAEALKSDTSRMLQKLSAVDFDECGTCEYLYLCGGGC